MKSIILLLVVMFFSVQKTQAQEYTANNGKPGEQKAKFFVKGSRSFAHDKDDSLTKQHEYSIFLPVFQTPDSTFSFSTKNQKIYFKDVSNQTADFTPVDSLSNEQFTLNYSWVDQEKSEWSLSSSYGSASEKPFANSSVSAFDVTAFKKVNDSEFESWTYFLNYSNNRTFLNGIPLPGFAYTYMNADRKSGGVLGIPFVMLWGRPDDRVFYSFFAFLPASIKANYGYMFAPPFQVNFKAELTEQTFFRSQRDDKKEQIYFESRKVGSSLKMFLGRDRFIELEVLRAFNQSLFNGTSIFKKTSSKEKLADEWQAQLSAQIKI